MLGWAAALALLAMAAAAAPPVLAIEQGSPAQQQGFDQWLKGLRKDAQAAGISKSTLDKALTGIAPNPKVIALDRKQPEFTMTFAEYRDRIVSEERIAAGHARLLEHRDLLEQIGGKYGVQPRFIVALWGLESRYGERMGEYPVVESLATLAFEGRRGKFFRKELLAALKIIDQDKIDPATMFGSWSGAMGQSQFIPTSFLAFAVDHDGDGKRDIWGSTADVFASIANYLSKSKWRADETWGRPVQLPPGFDAGLIGPKQERKLIEWQRLGLRTANGGTLPVRSDMSGYLVQPAGAEGPTFLAYANFKAILRWNRSDFFALAVGLLADRVSTG
jgi:membrane-bound lytic murein transglycosylase B